MTRPASSTCNSADGVVPWKTLAMRREDALDGWGRKISYRVFSGAAGFTQADGVNMTNCNTSLGAPINPALAAGSLCASGVPPPNTPAQFLGARGNMLVVQDMATTRNGNAFVLISHGESGYGAYLAEGAATRTTLPNSSGSEYPNTQASGTYMILARSSPDTPVSDASHFDDVVTYMSISDLAANAKLAARSWSNFPLSAHVFRERGQRSPRIRARERGGHGAHVPFPRRIPDHRHRLRSHAQRRIRAERPRRPRRHRRQFNERRPEFGVRRNAHVPARHRKRVRQDGRGAQCVRDHGQQPAAKGGRRDLVLDGRAADSDDDAQCMGSCGRSISMPAQAPYRWRVRPDGCEGRRPDQWRGSSRFQVAGIKACTDSTTPCATAISGQSPARFLPQVPTSDCHVALARLPRRCRAPWTKQRGLEGDRQPGTGFRRASSLRFRRTDFADRCTPEAAPSCGKLPHDCRRREHVRRCDRHRRHRARWCSRTPGSSESIPSS